MKELHIGKLIANYCKRNDISLKGIGNEMNMGKRYIYNALQRKDMSTYRIWQISEITGINFFELISKEYEKRHCL